MIAFFYLNHNYQYCRRLPIIIINKSKIHKYLLFGLKTQLWVESHALQSPSYLFMDSIELNN